MVPRTLSALVLAPAVVGFIYLGGVAFGLMMLCVAASMAFEWNRMCCGVAALAGAGFMAAAVAPLAIAAFVAVGPGLWAVAPAAAFAFAVVWIGGGRRPWAALGVAYIAVPCIAMIWLRADPALGLETVFWLFAAVWATDVGAYFTGRAIGGPKLAPRISPGKTWAGLAGGIVCAALVGVGAAWLLDISAAAGLVFVSAALAVVSQGGDLWESSVKRRFGVKDSGGLIPGHGGVLDRFDGLMTAAPTVAAIALMGGQGVLAWR